MNQNTTISTTSVSNSSLGGVIADNRIPPQHRSARSAMTTGALIGLLSTGLYFCSHLSQPSAPETNITNYIPETASYHVSGIEYVPEVVKPHCLVTSLEYVSSPQVIFNSDNTKFTTAQQMLYTCAERELDPLSQIIRSLDFNAQTRDRKSCGSASCEGYVYVNVIYSRNEDAKK